MPNFVAMDWWKKMETVLSWRPSSIPTRWINARRLRDEAGSGFSTVQLVWRILS